MKTDKRKITRMLKIARGQLDGLVRMVEEDRYSVDISVQIMSALAILRNVNKAVLQAHLESCIEEAFGESGDNEKMEEIIRLINKLSQ